MLWNTELTQGDPFSVHYIRCRKKLQSVHPLSRFLPPLFRVKNLIQTFNLYYIFLVWKRKKKMVNYPPVQLKRHPHMVFTKSLEGDLLNHVPGCPTYSKLSHIRHVHQPHHLITLCFVSLSIKQQDLPPSRGKKGCVCVSSMNFTLGL